MYLKSAANLLDAIAHDRCVHTEVQREDYDDGEHFWSITAISPTGEIWRSGHCDLLHAAVLLERLIDDT